MAKINPFSYQLKDGRNLTFRTIGDGDEETFLAFRRLVPTESTHTMMYVGMKLPTVDELVEFNRRDLENSLVLKVGVFDGPRLVGYLRMAPQHDGHPWVAHLTQFGMMILKEFWGHGVGKKLLQIQDEFAASVGITRIEAMVRAKNEAGVKLYQRAGFKIEGTRSEAALINGEKQDEYFIAKLLDDPFSSWKPETIETERLILRPIELRDAPAIFDYAKNPIVSEHSLWEPHLDPEDSVVYIKDYVFPYYAKGVPEPYGITLKSAPDTVIGTVGSFWTSRPAKSMELAYALSDKFWGKGYMPEAARAVMNKCIADNGLKRVQARCIEQNVQSATVMKKIGMQYEGTLRSSIFRRETHWDMAIYSFIVD